MSLKEIQNSPLNLDTYRKLIQSCTNYQHISTLNDAHDDYLNHYSHEIQQNHVYDDDGIHQSISTCS